jgi:hypothetical protein
VYEEVKFEPQLMCDEQELSATLASAQLEDGDILCLQAAPTPVRVLCMEAGQWPLIAHHGRIVGAAHESTGPGFRPWTPLASL